MESETLEHKVNVTFVSASLDDAKDELMEYYLKDFNVKEDDIKYDKEQIGDAYEGDYDFFKKRDYREYNFTFSIDLKYSEEIIRENIFTDSVTKFDFIKE